MIKRIESDLTQLPNIGTKLAETLRLTGINSANDLITVGTENAFIKLKSIDQNACINMLYAIEGAIMGIRWHDISIARKQELNNFFHSTIQRK